MRRSEIKFQAGSILRKEMLQDMYDYPRIAIESLYSDYSDGILYGLIWKEVDGNRHVICPGALKFQGNIYFLREELDVENEISEELNVNGYYRLCFVCQKIEKKIDSKTDFYLKLMALQSDAYKEVKDIAYWYAYVNYSGKKKVEILKGDAVIKYGVPGLISADDGFDFQLPNWLIKQQILEKLEKKKEKHPLDYQMLREIYAGKPISCSFINVYLNELNVEKLNVGCTPENALEILLEAIARLVFEVSVKDNGNNAISDGNLPPFRGGAL